MAHFMMGNGKMINKMGKELKFGQMALSIKAHILMELKMVLEILDGEMEAFM